LRGCGHDNGRACEKQIDFHAPENRGMLRQFKLKSALMFDL
jgi:hypothetical protein